MDFTAASHVVGGLGLFLLGMTFLTEGLKTVAGPSLATVLERSTRGRTSAIFTGFVFTAIIQSSSATTLVAIGFVNAGLLSLANVIGVIFGANLGTTMTAWIVSLVGVKVQASVFALPLIGVGSLMKLFFGGRIAAVGLAIAALGLIFHGIDMMQAGTANAGAWSDLGVGSADAVAGRLALAGLGALMTAVMQSSSAAIAVTLAALSTGTIGLADAAALAIGQNVGTTVTAVLGSLGGTANARRAAAAHVVFNLVTGVVALVVFTPLLDGVRWVAAELGAENPPTLLAAFHTGFNILGIVVMTPWVDTLAHRLQALVPDDEEAGPQARFLDRTVLTVPEAAVQAIRRELDHLLELSLDCISFSLTLASAPADLPVRQRGSLRAWFPTVAKLLRVRPRPAQRDLPTPDRLRDRVENIATRIGDFLEKVERSPGLAPSLFRLMRALTHLRSAAWQSIRAARHRKRSVTKSMHAPGLVELEGLLADAVVLMREGDGLAEPCAQQLEELTERASDARRIAREEIFAAVAEGRLSSSMAMELGDYANELERVLYDLGRASHYASGQGALTVFGKALARDLPEAEGPNAVASLERE